MKPLFQTRASIYITFLFSLLRFTSELIHKIIFFSVNKLFKRRINFNVVVNGIFVILVLY